MTFRNALVSFAIVAIGFWPAGAALGQAEMAHVEANAIEIAPVLTADVKELAGKRASIVTVTFQPGASSDPHRHPGTVLVYVLEGELQSALDGDDPKTYRAGDSWSEHVGALHRVAHNASNRPAKILAVVLHDADDALQLPPE